ncbi:MAG: DUF2764 family protein [Spirochaetales bacterium]
MSQHYYLVASLPTISYESKDAMSPEDFLELCRQQLSDDEYRAVAAASIDAPAAGALPDGAPVLTRWLEHERGLRNALVKLRAPGRGADAEAYMRRDEGGNDGTSADSITELAREAHASETPLGAETALNQARWRFLEDLETGHFFDLDRVALYYVKLQIIARRLLFDRKQGEERYNAVSERIMQEYYQESDREQSE